MKTVADVATIGGIVLASAILLLRFMDRSPKRNPEPYFSEIEGAADYALEGNAIGPVGAAITIVGFLDYECPVCARFEDDLAELKRSYPGQVRVVYRHLPLAAHRHAKPAAAAAECAAEQGAFETFHTTLLNTQKGIGVLSWSELARRGSVPDSSRFLQCLDSEAWSDRLKQDSLAAAKLGARMTPTLVIGPFRINGAPPGPQLQNFIERSLAQSEGVAK